MVEAELTVFDKKEGEKYNTSVFLNVNRFNFLDKQGENTENTKNIYLD
jgi:hypothetical protein